MNKEKFLYEMSQDRRLLTKDEKNEIIEKSMAACDWTVKTVIIMEELAELQKEVSKGYRFNGDNKLDIVEEMADVLMCMEFLKKHYGISEVLLNKALDVKYRRESDRRFTAV